MSIVESLVESERFGLRIGRATVDAQGDLPEEQSFDDYDVTFIRTPADNWTISSRLALLPAHAGFVADHLCHWARQGSHGTPIVQLPEGWTVDVDPPAEAVDAVVRSSFRGYVNHYAANPLLSTVDIADVYADWARRLADGAAGTATVLADDSGTPVAVAVVDWSGDRPDVRLAGVGATHQGRGLYAALLSSVLVLARERGADGVEISTQSHNTAVMRAWTRLGFEPQRTLATFHVVRRSLLADVVSMGGRR